MAQALSQFFILSRSCSIRLGEMLALLWNLQSLVPPGWGSPHEAFQRLGWQVMERFLCNTFLLPAWHIWRQGSIPWTWLIGILAIFKWPIDINYLKFIHEKNEAKRWSNMDRLFIPGWSLGWCHPWLAPRGCIFCSVQWHLPATSHQRTQLRSVHLVWVTVSLWWWSPRGLLVTCWLVLSLRVLEGLSYLSHLHVAPWGHATAGCVIFRSHWLRTHDLSPCCSYTLQAYSRALIFT